ncbi:hypothetical protein SAMN05421504_11730 [Amycolatopsis xylanica]|uniref:Uncharacterized protein n=1 Tax=Amycolatopsis xylanica TaxID=589385 RepID=A0A1H3T3A4_9PSEU|nr:hypothetical protein [Amycolatopsis xylanica]SDZ44321.1 hypothetical protein SAMN05421504_11730 [Amycolatopsis xylanica]
MIKANDRPAMLAVGRLTAGLAGESRRSAHLFDLDDDAVSSGFALARCGSELPLTDIEWLKLGMGMPCERCMGVGVATDQALLRRELGA